MMLTPLWTLSHIYRNMLFVLFVTELKITSGGQRRWSPKTLRHWANTRASYGKWGTTYGLPKRPTWRLFRSTPPIPIMLQTMPIFFLALEAKIHVFLSPLLMLMPKKSNSQMDKNPKNAKKKRKWKDRIEAHIYSFKGLVTTCLILPQIIAFMDSIVQLQGQFGEGNSYHLHNHTRFDGIISCICSTNRGF